MKNTLSSIYLRLDFDMQNLASKALAQIIVKLIFLHDGNMTKTEINNELTILNNNKSLDEREVNRVLEELVRNELSFRKGRYYLSKSRRNKIETNVSESKNRRDRIINVFFSGLNSEQEAIIEWLEKMTLIFFEIFSDEWISDLLSSTRHIFVKAETIREQIALHTNKCLNIDSEDRELLPQRFFDFINTRNAEVNDYLWEYGTSAFASKLICNHHGIDKLTMDIFRNSNCILDTNVLFFIALDSKYKDSFKALEKVFLDLAITPYYLFITKQEYENKVANQRCETLHNLEKYGIEITSLPNDDFTKTATSLLCRTPEDFTRFFDNTMHIPTHLYNELKINLLDNSTELANVIDESQHNTQLCDRLNTIFESETHRRKRTSACMHDIGMLEGVKFLRKDTNNSDNKYFIISDDFSVNKYAREAGIKNWLPLSMRLDTLINMLAINNGGDTFDAADYKPLFANIIRLGLTPRKDTFRQTELYQMAQMNSRITHLPAENIKSIATEIHHRFVLGESEDLIRRDLNEMVTKGEIVAKDEVRRANEELQYQQDVNKQLKDIHKHDREYIKQIIKDKVTNEFDNETRRQVRNCILLFIIIAIFVAASIFFILNHTIENSLIDNFIISMIASAIINIVSFFIKRSSILKKRRNNKNKQIEENVIKELSAYDDKI